MLYPESTTTQLSLNHSMAINYRDNHVRDYQVSKAYKWQRSFFMGKDHGEKMSRAEADRLIAEVFHAYGLPTPEIRHKEGSSCSWAVGIYKDPYIQLASWGRNPETILHEVAHGINCYADYCRSGHGAEWMRIFLDLLARYTDTNTVDMEAYAIASGLKVAPAEAAPTVDTIGNVADAWTFDVGEAIQKVANAWTF